MLNEFYQCKYSFVSSFETWMTFLVSHFSLPQTYCMTIFSLFFACLSSTHLISPTNIQRTNALPNCEKKKEKEKRNKEQKKNNVYMSMICWAFRCTISITMTKKKTKLRHFSTLLQVHAYYLT